MGQSFDLQLYERTIVQIQHSGLVRLGLHVPIFSTSICGQFCRDCCFFFALWSGATFLLVSADNSKRGEIELIKIHFWDVIPFLHAKWGHSSTWSRMFYSQHLRTSLRFYVDKLSAVCKDVCRKNLSIAHGHRPTCFNFFFCGIVRR